VGHTGTLDPFATGLLVIVMGGATRLARFVEGERKEYRAVARLGRRTDTDDGTGAPLGADWTGAWPSEARIREALAAMVGTAPQRPPAYSAKKVAGTRSYALARQGEAVELAPAVVTVDRIELIEYRPPEVVWVATVGRGTYLRAMARDLGDAVGTGAHLTALRRGRVGAFRVEDAIPMAGLTGQEPLIAPLDLIPLPRIVVSADEVLRIRRGQRVGAEAEGSAALVHEGELIAVADARGGQWQPVTVLAA
jgi:tRNA pseudouridine55 synthase